MSTTNQIYNDGPIPLFSDAYQILEPTSDVFKSFPFLKSRMHEYTKHQVWNLTKHEYELGNNYFGLKNAIALMHRHQGQIVSKMLLCYIDGDALSYRHVHARLFPSESIGHDKDTFKSLIDMDLIAFSHKGPRGLKLYKITDLGKEVCKIIAINYKFYRIIRWFKIDDENARITAMMNADLCGEDTQHDTSSNVIIELLEELFDPASKMHDVGSCFRIMNSLMSCLKQHRELFNKFDALEVQEWLHQHASTYFGISKFIDIFNKIKNKWKIDS